MTMSIYAVTGASGHVGRFAVQQLLARGVPASDVVAVVRTRGKARGLAAVGVQVRAADYSRPETLGAALAGVSRILYTSKLNADDSASPLAGEHRDTERVLRDAGVPFTVLRMPKMSTFLATDEVEAFCLPQGQLSALYRAIAAGRPGILSRIGLGTFVDPRLDGGRLNERARLAADGYVELFDIDGGPYILYRSFPIDVGIIRATSIDPDGNCSQEEEAVHLDALAIAQAAHNSGGRVICQAKRMVGRGAIDPKNVAVPGCLIDLVTIAESPDSDHRQTDSTAFDPRFISARAEPPDGLGALPSGERADIGRRAIALLRPGDIVNIGTGIPGDTIGAAMAEAGLADSVTLTVESGAYGGIPQGGTDFGITIGPSAIISHPTQFDFYGGGGLDIAFMGAGQVDRRGNVNVSRLGGRVIGCGGFIDIVQSAKRVCFCFIFAGRNRKFVEAVEHQTFSAEQALARGQQVFYITERATFTLAADGLRLVDVVPGLDADKDVLALLPFPVRTQLPGDTELAHVSAPRPAGSPAESSPAEPERVGSRRDIDPSDHVSTT
jgi:propionate CoA-transferase